MSAIQRARRSGARPTPRSPRRSARQPGRARVRRDRPDRLRRASRTSAGVSSRGSPTPKSITLRPASTRLLLAAVELLERIRLAPRASPGDRWVISQLLRSGQERRHDRVGTRERGHRRPARRRCERTAGPPGPRLTASTPAIAELRDRRPRLLRAAPPGRRRPAAASRAGCRGTTGPGGRVAEDLELDARMRRAARAAAPRPRRACGRARTGS